MSKDNARWFRFDWEAIERCRDGLTLDANVTAPLANFVAFRMGAWIAVSPFFLDGAGTAGTIAAVVIGLGLVGLSLPRGTRSEDQYGGWDRAIV